LKLLKDSQGSDFWILELALYVCMVGGVRRSSTDLSELLLSQSQFRRDHLVSFDLDPALPSNDFYCRMLHIRILTYTKEDPDIHIIYIYRDIYI
jgi:hypothetical protein